MFILSYLAKFQKALSLISYVMSFYLLSYPLYKLLGTTCNIRPDTADPCWSNPCRNSGTCIVLNGQATCQCTSSFTGNRCETPRQTCGGVTRNPTGTLQFPMDSSTYQHGLSCAWVLITDPSKVLNVTFTVFNLEDSRECKYDFLQVRCQRYVCDNKNCFSLPSFVIIRIEDTQYINVSNS